MEHAKAVEAAKRARELYPGKGFYLEALAAAYAEIGDFDEAVRCQQEAIDGVPRVAHDKTALQRLKLYRQGQPYRQQSPP